MSYQPVSDNAFTEMIATVGVAFGRSLRLAGRAFDDQHTLDLLLYSKDEADRTCAGTDALRRGGRDEDAFVWIQRAAALGHTAAMADYSDHAFTEFADHAALLDNADEVAGRRKTAKRMLDLALRAGEPKALLALAKAHDQAGWLQRDRIRALAFWDAYRQSVDGLALPRTIATLGSDHYRQQLGAAQQEEAGRLSLQIQADQLRARRGR